MTKQGQARAGSVTLTEVADVLGPNVLSVVVAPGGIDTIVGEPAIYDGGDDVVYRSSMVVTPGLRPNDVAAITIAGRLGLAGAAALVIKARGDSVAALADACTEIGLALCVCDDSLSWRRLLALLAGACAVPGRVEQADSASDLFALANAVAAAVGGAVAVEDAAMRVLAYSTNPDYPIDELRRLGILGRRAPAAESNHERYRALLRGDGVLHLNGEPPSLRPRLAVAVRAGEEMLGSLWVVAGDQPFTAEADAALINAAGLAALHLLRARSAADVDRHVRGEQFRSLLEGRLDRHLVQDRLAVDPDIPARVIAVEPRLAVDTPIEIVTLRLATLVSLRCEALWSRSSTVAVGRVVYALIPGSAQVGEETLTRVAKDVVDRGRVTTGVDIRVGIGLNHPVRNASQSRAEADRVLRVFAGRKAWGTHGGLDALRAPAMLSDLHDLLGVAPAVRLPAVGALIRHDDLKGTEYRLTLRAFFDALGDVPTAATAVGLHHNTFRYRLRRIEELFGLDLHDPETRLAAWIHLVLCDDPATQE